MATGIYDDKDLRPKHLAEQDQTDAAAPRTEAQQDEIDRLNENFYRPENPADIAKPSADNGEGGKKGGKKRLAKLKGWAGKHKKMLFIAGPAAGIGLGGIIMILFILSSLLLPNFIQQTMALRFANSARAYRQANSQVESKKLSMSILSDSQIVKLAKAGGEKAKTLRDNVLLKKYRPGAIVDKLESTGQLTYETVPRATVLQVEFGSRISAIVLHGQRIPVSDLNRWATPFGGRADDNTLKSVRLASSIDDVLAQAMHADGAGTAATVLRTGVGAEILGRLNYRKFYAWSNKAKDYKNVAARDADRILLREVHARATGAGVQGKPSVPANQKAVDEVLEADKEAYTDDAKTTEMVQKGGASASVIKALQDGTKGSIVDTAIKAVSGTGAIAMTACAIVDGSAQASAPVMDAKAEAASRQFMFLASAAHQQQTGETVSEAVRAVNDKLNDEGGAVRSTSMDATTNVKPTETESPYAGAAGDFTILNAAFTKFLGADPDNAAVGTANDVCNVVGSYQFAITAGGLEIFVGIITGGAGEVAERVATLGLTRAIGTYLKDYTATLFTKKSVTKLVAQGGTVGGATLLARMVTANYANQYYNGASKDLALAEEANAGAEVLNNEVSRTLGGAPMTGADAEQALNSSKKDNAAALSQQTMFDRYLAVTNPESLLSRVGYATMGRIHTPVMANILTMAANVFNPMAIMGMVGKLSPAVSAANTSPSSYTRTDIGWTDAELKLVDTKRSYNDFDENDCILDGGRYSFDDGSCSGGSDANRNKIEETYGRCWKDSMGTLFASAAIVRNEDGTPKENEGLCSPKNLGPNNDQGFGDLVFRWRISKRAAASLQIGGEISDAVITPGAQQ